MGDRWSHYGKWDQHLQVIILTPSGIPGAIFSSQQDSKCGGGGYPGLVQEYQALCTELQLPKPNTASNLSWNRLVKKIVTEANRVELLKLLEEKYEKLEYEYLKYQRQVKVL